MKNIMLGIFALSFLLSVESHASFAKDTSSQALLNKANRTAPLEGIGTVVDRSKNLMVAVYDFAVSGGVSGSTNYLLDDAGNVATLPLGAIVTNVVGDVITTMASSGAGAATISLSLLTATDLMSAKNSAALVSSAPFVAGAPVGTAATWVGPVTSVYGSQISARIASGTVTAGKVKYFIEYVIQ